MSIQPVVRLPREVRMDQILDAATDEFRSLGFENTSMSRIAKRAGIVEGSIYRYFIDKADLLTKVIERWYVGMLADYAKQLALIDGTRSRLRYMIWRHLKTVHAEPELCRLMFNKVRSSAHYRGTSVYRLNSQYTSRTLDIIREGISAGELRNDLNLSLIRDLIYGGVEHQIWSYLRNEGEFDPDKTADSIVDMVVNGAGKRSNVIDQLQDIESRMAHLVRIRGNAVLGKSS